MSENEDLALLLEVDTLTFLRTIGIFLVLGIALYGFTENGKIFSLISLTIALILTISVTTNYFIERSRIYKLGYEPRTLIDILMFTMVFVIFFISWIIYTVCKSEPVSLATIAKDIENKMTENTMIYTENLKSLLGKTDTVPLKHTNGTISKNLLKAGDNKSRVNIAALAMTA
jgi:hypothetical protein